jgi:hypothetical protein
MDLIEQAIFTFADTDRGSGYHVAANSPGVCEADIQELATWGPAHDALLMPGMNAQSLNFHPLPSGSYCVSRTTPAGVELEYGARMGARLYTQCLIVSPQLLLRFANSPFALFRAALAAGAICQYEELPSQLESFRLPGRATAVDSSLLTRLCGNPGPEWMAAMVQAALDSATMAIAGGPPAEHVIAGLLNCLPLECRTEFSFSTNLRFSSRRPFRIVALSGDAEEQRRVEQIYHLTVLRLFDSPPAEWQPIDGWARFIQRVLKSGRISFLASRIAHRRLNFSFQDLPILGLQLLEELDAASLDAEAAESETDGGEAAPIAGATSDANEAGTEESIAAADALSDAADNATSEAHAPGQGVGHSVPSREHRQSHAAHSGFGNKSNASAAVRPKSPPPSKQLAAHDPSMLETLERLDDLVFEAIAGRTDALEQLKALWPEVCHKLDAALFDESREQYLRYAITVWAENAENGGSRDPARAIQSLDVLSLLFNDDDDLRASGG